MVRVLETNRDTNLVIQEHTIPEHVYGEVAHKINKINKRLVKAGKNPIEIYDNKLVQDFKLINGKHYPESMVSFKICFEKPKIRDWELVASLEFIKNENIFNLVSGTEIPAELNQYKNTCACDHCKHNRKRLYTYILKNNQTNEYKQVGKTCLQDFLGTDTLVFELIATLDVNRLCRESKSDSEGTGEGIPLPNSLDIELFLAGTIMMVKKYGYYKKDSAKPTGKRVWGFLSCGLSDADLNELNSYQNEVQKMLEWTLSLQNNSNQYFHNIYVLAQTKVVRERYAILASSIYNAYISNMKYKKSQEEKERKLQEEHPQWKLKYKPEDYNREEFLGKPKEKFERFVKVEAIRQIDSVYGVSDCISFRDEYGEILVWFTQSEHGFKVFDENTITGQVKGYYDNRGHLQANISRVKRIS